MRLSAAHLAELQAAKKLLEHPGLAIKLTDVLGTPLEKGLALLPQKWAEIVHAATRKSIEKALKFAVMTMNRNTQNKASNLTHKIAVATTGAAGGAFGLLSLPVELPISTILMLRSIADIARSEGDDLDSPETILNCVQVFALGGTTEQDNATETGYYAIRAALSKAVSDAAKYIAERGFSEKGAPVLVRLIAMIAARFGVVVSEKIAAMTIPVIGAVGGALVNTIFIDHFQNVARAHFMIRRLERKYGADLIQQAYEKINN